MRDPAGPLPGPRSPVGLAGLPRCQHTFWPRQRARLEARGCPGRGLYLVFSQDHGNDPSHRAFPGLPWIRQGQLSEAPVATPMAWLLSRVTLRRPGTGCRPGPGSVQPARLVTFHPASGLVSRHADRAGNPVRLFPSPTLHTRVASFSLGVVRPDPGVVLVSQPRQNRANGHGEPPATPCGEPCGSLIVAARTETSPGADRRERTARLARSRP